MSSKTQISLEAQLIDTSIGSIGSSDQMLQETGPLALDHAEPIATTSTMEPQEPLSDLEMLAMLATNPVLPPLKSTPESPASQTALSSAVPAHDVKKERRMMPGKSQTPR